jgi:hypothetical protein
MWWWSDYYKQPIKSKLLLSYSVEELYYEYCYKTFTKESVLEDKRNKEDKEWADNLDLSQFDKESIVSQTFDEVF